MKKTTFLLLLIVFPFLMNGQNYTELTAGGTSPLSSVDTNFEIGDTRTSFSIDYDADGDADIISINASNNAWHLLRNDGTGSFTTETGTTIGLSIANPVNFIVMDYDNDGDQDIIDPVKGADTQAAIFRNDGGTFVELTAGGTSPLSSVDTNFEIGDTRTSFSIDYDVDGDEDIISINSAISAWHLLRNNGSGSFVVETGTTINLSINNPENFFVIDYDNDDDTDIVDTPKGIDTDAAIFSNNNAPPKVLSSIPMDNSTDFDSSANIEITFNESISKGTGNIEIRKVSDNSLVESIDVINTSVSGSILTIDPTNNLDTGIDLYIHIDAGSIIDADNEITVSLNNNPQTLNFTANSTLSLDNSLLNNEISVYPNPVNATLNINTNAIEIHEACLYDILGKSIKYMNIENTTLDFSIIHSGIYLLKLETDKGVLVKKIVKQ